jgi:hypothetical protein
LVLPAANKDLPLQIGLFLPFFFPIEMYGIYLSGISSISSSILSGKRRSFEVGKYHRKSVVTLGCINIYIYLI